MTKDLRIGARIDWKEVLEVADRESAGIVLELQSQFAAVEDRAVVIAQKREQYLVMKHGVCRMPIDVEPLCIG